MCNKLWFAFSECRTFSSGATKCCSRNSIQRQCHLSTMHSYPCPLYLPTVTCLPVLLVHLIVYLTLDRRKYWGRDSVERPLDLVLFFVLSLGRRSLFRRGQFLYWFTDLHYSFLHINSRSKVWDNHKKGVIWRLRNDPQYANITLVLITSPAIYKADESFIICDLWRKIKVLCVTFPSSY